LQRCFSIYSDGNNAEVIRIAMPAAVAKSSGFVKGDYIIVKHAKGICRLERTNDRSSGFALSMRGSKITRPCLSFTANEKMKLNFFPNGKKAYDSSIYESRPNTLEFLIGETVK
jgi:hypothetical protein